MDIRPIEQSEYEKMIAFLEIVFKENMDELLLNSRDKDLLTIDSTYKGKTGEFWGLFSDNDALVGSIAVRCINDLTEQTYLEIRRFYVHKSVQGCGWGSKLLNTALEYCYAQPYKMVRITTSFSKSKAIAMFARRGFYRIEQYRSSTAELFLEKCIKPDYSSLYERLNHSLLIQEKEFEKSLILNPVENVPDQSILLPSIGFLHGLYNTDSPRNDTQKKDTKIQFSGRDLITQDIKEIYKEWAALLGGEAISMRLLSGLHAHIILFMSIGSIGDRVLLLPEIAGGHMATKSILLRLGFEVQEFAIDYPHQRVDIEETLKIIDVFHPKFIFVDRSEGLLYEDFSWMSEVRAYKIFDASQYLTNIISGDYLSPFSMGFDMILSTTHKNLPGPQRALICAKVADELWIKLRSGISTYVSNMHVFTIYSEGLLLYSIEKLKHLSREMLNNAVVLENALEDRGLPVVKRQCNINEPATHHIWIVLKSKEDAYRLFVDLERIGLLTNYRKLPYKLGYGLRLGLSAATFCGLKTIDIEELANCIAEAYFSGYSNKLKEETNQLISRIKGLSVL